MSCGQHHVTCAPTFAIFTETASLKAPARSPEVDACSLPVRGEQGLLLVPADLYLYETRPGWQPRGEHSCEVTATQVHRYGLCPAFAAATVLPGAPRQPRRVRSEDDEFARNLGTAAHLLIQGANQRLIGARTVDLNDLLDAHWNSSLFVRDRRQAARELCGQFLWEYLHYLQSERLQVLAAEQDIWATGVLHEDEGAPPLRFTLKGRIDCLVRRGEAVVALDVKTARLLPTRAELAADPASMVYYLLATRYLTVRGDPSRVLIGQLGLRRGAAVEVELNASDIGAGKAILRSLVLALHDRDAYAATPGVHCSYCPLNRDCPCSPLRPGSATGDVWVDGDEDSIVI